jgi:hypothetical protein
MLHAGDIAPEFELATADGQRAPLSGILHGRRSVLLIFLRHLGRLPGREHVAQLCQ